MGSEETRKRFEEDGGLKEIVAADGFWAEVMVFLFVGVSRWLYSFESVSETFGKLLVRSTHQFQ